MDWNNESKKVIEKFAEQLASRRFFGKRYYVYIFSLEAKDDGKNYAMKLEASDNSLKINGHKDHDDTPLIPNRPGTRVIISTRHYLKYHYSHEDMSTLGYILRFHNNNVDDSLKIPGDEVLWREKVLYYCSYKFGKTPLVVYLVFDMDREDQVVHEKLPHFFLTPILKGVEDNFHKKIIFNADYLTVLHEKLDPVLFEKLKVSINNLKRDERHPNYLRKIYYEFLIDNFSIYKDYLDSEHQFILMQLAQSFEESQKNLFRIPNYRDHFLHQYNVYILGTAVISIIKEKFGRNLIKDFNEAYFPMDSQKYDSEIQACLIWFLCSMFHDIANPIEKCGQWLAAFSQEYISQAPDNLKKDEDELDITTPLLATDTNMSNFVEDIGYSNCFEELAEYLRRSNFDYSNKNKDNIDYKNLANKRYVNKGCEIRTQILGQIIRKKDHGVLSALLLLYKLRSHTQIFRYLFPAAAAIAMHNIMWIDDKIYKKPCHKCDEFKKFDDSPLDMNNIPPCQACNKWIIANNKYFKKWNEHNKNNPNAANIDLLKEISYDNDPIGFLLLVCDLLHDWGRHSLENLKQASNPLYNPTKLTGLDCREKCITFNINIEPLPQTDDKKETIKNTARLNILIFKKKQFISQVFSRLRFIEGHDISIRFSQEKKVVTEFKLSSFLQMKEEIEKNNEKKADNPA